MRPRFLRRALVVAVLAFAAGGLLAPADALAAVPTVRLDPNNTIFPVGSRTPVEIWAGNVTDLQGFKITLIFDPGFIGLNPADPNNANYVVDPNLLAMWGILGVNTFTINNSTGVLTWNVKPATRIPGMGPNGTVRLGTLFFTGAQSGTTGDFIWDPNTRLTQGSSEEDNTSPDGVNATFAVGTANSDLVIACTPTSPADPNFFVDGDTVTLDCTVSNLGPGRTPVATAAAAVISSDTIVDKFDTWIGDGGVGILSDPNGGASSHQALTLSGAPTFTVPGNYFICSKVDVDAADLNRSGSVYETSENNTGCYPVHVLAPTRDLQPTALTVDPNGIQAGTLFSVTYTIKNNGAAVVRGETNAIRLSADPNIDASDPVVCQLAEVYPPGIPGGTSIERTYGNGTGSDPNKPQCKIDFTQGPGAYWIGVDADSTNQVFEQDPNGVSLEGNNTRAVPVQILPPQNPEMRAHETTYVDTQVDLIGPTGGNRAANVSIARAVYLSDYSFTLRWSDPNLIQIADPNIDVVFTTFLQQNGRVQSCGVTSYDPNNGTISVACTTTGSARGATSETPSLLVTINFTMKAPGGGTLTFPASTAHQDDGSPVTLTVGASTYLVGGFPVMEIQNAVAPSTAYTGVPFNADFNLCNVGFGPSTPGIKTTVYVSKDATLDPNVDIILCSFTETEVMQARGPCGARSLPCTIKDDLLPGEYSLIFAENPTKPVVEPLPLPPRVLALRKFKDRKQLDSTAAPDSSDGSVGDLLGFDKKWDRSSMGVIGSEGRNLDFLAGYVKLPDLGQRVRIYKLPRRPGEDLDPNRLTELRLPGAAKAILGGADVEGDGEDEMILLLKDKTGEYLDFRSINFSARKPVVGISVALTESLDGEIVSAAGVQWDDDDEDEIAVVVDTGGAQTLTIYDLEVAQPPARSTPNPVADDLFFGTSGETILSICGLNWDLSEADEIAALTENADGLQSLKIFSLPATVGGSVGPPLADDPAYGGTPDRKRAFWIACTR